MELPAPPGGCPCTLEVPAGQHSATPSDSAALFRGMEGLKKQKNNKTLVIQMPRVCSANGCCTQVLEKQKQNRTDICVTTTTKAQEREGETFQPGGLETLHKGVGNTEPFVSDLSLHRVLYCNRPNAGRERAEEGRGRGSPNPALAPPQPVLTSLVTTEPRGGAGGAAGGWGSSGQRTDF